MRKPSKILSVVDADLELSQAIAEETALEAQLKECSEMLLDVGKARSKLAKTLERHMGKLEKAQGTAKLKIKVSIKDVKQQIADLNKEEKQLAVLSGKLSAQLEELQYNIRDMKEQKP